MLPQIPIPSTPLSLSAMALGAGAFDGRLDERTLDWVYAAFRVAGGTTFDTAHCYCFWLPGGAGCAERALGAAVRRHGDVGKVQVVTKGGHPGTEPGYSRPDGYLSPEVLTRDIAESLERLGLGPIDLYLLHRDDPRVPVGEIVDALSAHVVAGQLRALGVSNWATARIEAANAYAQRRGSHGFVLSQPQFNLACPTAPVPPCDPAMRYLTDTDLAWHGRTGLPVMAYSPAAGGYFASGGERGRGAFDNPTSRARLARATVLARELGVTPGQVALAYLLGQDFPVVPILGTASPEHLAESLGAADIRLTPAQVEWLRHGGHAPTAP